MNSKLYTVAIIGAGRIGAGFDTPQSKNILTHAHAFSGNKRTKLIGFVDSDEKRGLEAAEKWSTAYYPTLAKLSERGIPDITVIATPDDTHVSYLEECAQYRPKLIVCEKPLLVTEKEAEVLQARMSDIRIMVNFSRRFDATVRDVQKALKRGDYGRVISASCLYTGGLYHNGSHALDLAQFFFGTLLSVRGTGAPLCDRAGDPSIGGVAIYEHCPEFHLMRGDARTCAIFEFDIVTEKKRIRFTDEGRLLSMAYVGPDSEYAGFFILRAEHVQETQLSRALAALAEHAVSVIDNEESADISTIQNAARVYEACRLFADSAKTA